MEEERRPFEQGTRCEGCGREIGDDESCHVWADGVLTCMACGGPEAHVDVVVTL
jgi:hypothetical protein